MNLRERLDQVRAEYVATLPSRADALEAQLAEVRSADEARRAALGEDLHRVLHNMVGTAGVQGLGAVASAAERLMTRLVETSPADSTSAADWPETAELLALLRGTP